MFAEMTKKRKKLNTFHHHLSYTLFHVRSWDFFKVQSRDVDFIPEHISDLDHRLGQFSVEIPVFPYAGYLSFAPMSKPHPLCTVSCWALQADPLAVEPQLDLASEMQRWEIPGQTKRLDMAHPLHLW